MNSVDYKFCGILSTRLQKYQVKQTTPFQANFRCYVCGDSQKSQSKTRGWLLERNDNTWYYCHNCHHSSSLGSFLKQYFTSDYNDYIVARIFDNKQSNIKVKLELPEIKPDNSPLQTIRKVATLESNHPVKMWLNDRMIPTESYSRLYFAPAFNKWSNTVIKDRLPTSSDESRLVLPFNDENKNLFGYSGRSFLPESNLRYITMLIDNSKPKIYGLDTVDFSKPYFVVEGQLDSLFLNNAVAMAGASVDLKGLENLKNATFVFDNEPRNLEIISKMKKLIYKGFRVVIWHEKIPSGMDINDLVVKLKIGLPDIEKMLCKAGKIGLSAEINLSHWKKRGINAQTYRC